MLKNPYFAQKILDIQNISAVERQTYSDYSGGQDLANHPSALKRARQNEIKRIRNKSYKTRVKKAVKEVRTAVADNSADRAKDNLAKAVSIIQKTASKGVIHKKKAARTISRLAHLVNRPANSS
jgi:small subunit ribosomal protein S20